MTTTTQPAPRAPRSTRLARLLPGGVPRYVRCYESPPEGPAHWDRFTVVFTGRAAPSGRPSERRQWSCVGLSGHSFSWDAPCDVNRHGYAQAMGRTCHLGRRVPWSAMPESLRRTALADYLEIWGLAQTPA